MSFAQTLAPITQPTILQRLKSETAAAHEALETGLDILAEPLSQARFTRLIERFWGFHAAWEPMLASTLGDNIAAPRSKLGHLRTDLRALGLSADDIDRLPLCVEAAQLARRPAAAIGSLYVLEGSTLGGQVISRALAKASWLPAGGLTYFDPYGARTGAMWRAFRDYAVSYASPAADAEMIAAARATFERLQAWLT